MGVNARPERPRGGRGARRRAAIVGLSLAVPLLALLVAGRPAAAESAAEQSSSGEVLQNGVEGAATPAGAAPSYVTEGAPKDEVARRVEQRLIELRERSRRMMEQRLAAQRVSPEEEAAQRAARWKAPLGPGEPVWIERGKSRVLELPVPVKRVSIGDPDLAGIVVLSPTTIMINAKPSGERPETQASLDLMMVGSGTTPMGRTLTPEPNVKETTLVVWGAADQYDVHTLMIADFLDQQVMLVQAAPRSWNG